MPKRIVLRLKKVLWIIHFCKKFDFGGNIYTYLILLKHEVYVKSNPSIFSLEIELLYSN